MPNNEYANEPNQSRSEDIIQSILDGTEYDEAARSRIEYLLIELKNAIEGGGGGGGVTSYSPLTEKPKIDNHTLQSGNNTSSDLGLQTKIDADHKLSADVIDDTNSTNKFNVKSDWNAASGAAGEILNKPTLGTASAKNVPASGDAATGEVVLGSDTRLTDARNAKDVYNWAKQENKPSYGYSEIQNTPTIPDKLSDLTDDTTHRTVTDTEKNTWNGKQNALTFDNAPTSNSDNPVKSGGVYTALSGKQNNLSEAQMAAANSGIDSTKVAQIETNKNNILLGIENNGKSKNKLDISNISTLSENTDANHVWNSNVCTVRGAITFTINSDNSITVSGNNTTNYSCVLTLAQNTQLTATDRLSGCPAGGATSGGYILAAYNNNDTAIGLDIGNGDTISQTATMGYVRISVAKNVNIGTKTFYPMIISNDMYSAGFTDYQPYALPNTTLTPALVECVDRGAKNYSSITGLSKDTTTAGFASETNFGAIIPAGTYVVSYDLTRSDNAKTGVIGFRDVDGAYTDIGYYWTTASHQVQTVTFSKAVKAINMYVAAGTTCTLSNLMICKEEVYKASSTYQPYALSNAELTNNILSLLPTSYSLPTLIDDTTCTINDGGYITVGNIIVVNVTFTTSASYTAYGSIMQFPAPKNSGSITMVAAAHIDSSVNVAVNKFGQLALFDTQLPAGTYHFFTVYLKQ